MTTNQAVADFFRRHHAVPANDTGLSWSKVTDAVLLDWYQSKRSIVHGWNREAQRDATPEERSANVSIYNEIVAELYTRAKRPDASADIMAAYFVCQIR